MSWPTVFNSSSYDNRLYYKPIKVHMYIIPHHKYQMETEFYFCGNGKTHLTVSLLWLYYNMAYQLMYI